MKKHLSLIGYLLMVSLILSPIMALAQVPDNLKFVNLSAKKPTARIACNLNDGETLYRRIEIVRRGAAIRLPAKAGKKVLAVKDVNGEGVNRYTSWACDNSTQSGQDGQLYVKLTPKSTPVALDLSITDFEDKLEDDTPSAPGDGIDSQCTSTESLPSAFIYKTIGSHHFSDCRRTTAGLIVKAGYPGTFPSSAEVLDTQGNVRATLGGYYPAGSDWKWRGYACWGAGKNTPYSGAKIASDAKAATGSSNVYVRLGTKCYGPIDAGKCYNSSSC